MTSLGNPVLVLSIVLGIVLFRSQPGHRLVIGMFVAGSLFLPEYGSSEFIEGVPPPITFLGIKLTKENSISLGLLVGSLLYDRRRWLEGRPRWFDLPILAWCVGPVISSMTNSLAYDDPVSTHVSTSAGFVSGALSWLVTSDLYDGAVRSISVVLTWGVPYCLARLYITDLKALTDLAFAIVIGAAVYVPLCWLEMLLSPQLHRWVYGFHQHEFLQTVRFDGYRPMVFLEHGLAVGFWMTAGSLAAVWLWLRGPMRTVPFRGRDVSGLWVVLPLCFTALMCKSTGAVILGLVGFTVLVSTSGLRRPIPVVLLMCVAPLYATVRAEGSWQAEEVVSVMRHVVGNERAESLEFRLENENMLAAKALARPLVGWGGWGRSRVYDQHGKALTVADGMWIITLGERGLFGLVTMNLVLLLPVAALLVRHGAQPWTHQASAAAGVAAVILVLFSIDCLSNSMLNPAFVLIAGSLIALPRHDATPAQPGPQEAAAKSWRVLSHRQRPRVTALSGRSRVQSLPGSRVPTPRKHDGQG